LLQYARDAKVERFVYISSSCVYGNKQIALHEDDPEYNLDTPYAITKLLGERYTTFFYKHDGLKTVILRYFNAYGPGEYPGKYRNVIPNFFALAMQGDPLPITGTGEETRDFTFNRDTVEGTIRTAEYEGAIGKIINIGSGKETKTLTLAEKINALTGNTAGVVFEQPRSWDLIRRRVASIEIAKSVLEYFPSTDLDEGLKRTYSWLQSVRTSFV
jgi:nucleoside-diphosphate-sugar epimerase